MDARISQLPPHTCEQHLDFLSRPAEAVLLRRPCENSETYCTNTFKSILQGPDAF